MKKESEGTPENKTDLVQQFAELLTIPERTKGKQKNVVIRPKLPQQSRGRRTQTMLFEVEGNIGASG